MVPITEGFFHYMVSVPAAVKAECDGGGSGNTDYRHHSRVGCVDTRWLSTVGIADNVCLSEMRETDMCVMSRPIHQQSFSVRGRLFAYRCSRGQGYDAAFYCGVSCTGNGETALSGTEFPSAVLLVSSGMVRRHSVIPVNALCMSYSKITPITWLMAWKRAQHCLSLSPPDKRSIAACDCSLSVRLIPICVS
jgi:hypothetical protein